MIQLSNAAKQFGGKLLFEKVNWLVAPQDRIGLVGPNGSGKSTLLKILCGIESLDAGAVNKGDQRRISSTRGLAAIGALGLRRVPVGFRFSSRDGD